VATQGYAAYKEARVTTASGGRLIVMLYDAAVKRLAASLEALEENAYEDVHNHLIKVQDILAELSGSLDMQFEISKNLYALYEYCTDRLIAANISKDAAPIKEVLGYLTELRDAWQQAVQIDARAHAEAKLERKGASSANGIEISG